MLITDYLLFTNLLPVYEGEPGEGTLYRRTWSLTQPLW